MSGETAYVPTTGIHSQTRRPCHAYNTTNRDKRFGSVLGLEPSGASSTLASLTIDKSRIIAYNIS